MGRSTLYLHWVSSSARLSWTSLIGVELQISIARCGSEPDSSANSMMFLTILTMHGFKETIWLSVPWACTWNLHWIPNALNSLDANWAPWSVYTTAGIPYSVKLILRRPITWPYIWLDSFFTIDISWNNLQPVGGVSSLSLTHGLLGTVHRAAQGFPSVEPACVSGKCYMLHSNCMFDVIQDSWPKQCLSTSIATEFPSRR